MQLRIDKGLSLEELGEICEMKPKAILRIEQGKYNVSVDLIQQIVKPMGGKLDIVWDDDNAEEVLANKEDEE